MIRRFLRSVALYIAQAPTMAFVAYIERASRPGAADLGALLYINFHKALKNHNFTKIGKNGVFDVFWKFFGGRYLQKNTSGYRS